MKASENDKPEPDAPTGVMRDDTLDFLECMDGTASDGDSDIEIESESEVQTSPGSNRDDTLEFLDCMGEGSTAPSSRPHSRYSHDEIRRLMLGALNKKNNG